MKILERLHHRLSRGNAGDPGTAEASSTDADRFPIPGQGQLEDKQVGAVGPARGRGLMPTAGQPVKRDRFISPLGRVEAARDEREQLREEARYRRDRLALYKARVYGGRPLREGKLREYQRAADGAAARLRRAEAKAPSARPPA